MAWAIANALVDANQTGFRSGYSASVMKTIIKIAEQFLCQPDEIITELRGHAQALASAKGMAERNVAKLRMFTPDRIPLFFSVTDRILDAVNARSELKRKQRGSKLQRLTNRRFDVEQCRDIMCAVAQELMLVRAPRSANVINARLDWLRWSGDSAIIVVPATDVKMRSETDPELLIELPVEASRLLRQYIEKVRPSALLTGDDENPYLFPGQGHRLGQPYENLLERLVTWVFRIVGAKIHPHLYRHLIGWIWLREDLGMLPVVQQLLGHKSLQTTIDYYAAIDSSLAMQRWNDFLNEKKRKH